jgi:5-methylcytosine-specific restriction enzyme A
LRQGFPRSVKMAAWHRSGNQCERCSARLFAGHITYDHIVPDALGGQPTLENCQCLCDVCDDIKTNKGNGLQWGDKTRIAKAARLHEERIGARDRRAAPMPGTRASGWKFKMDGTRERRR